MFHRIYVQPKKALFDLDCFTLKAIKSILCFKYFQLKVAVFDCYATSNSYCINKKIIPRVQFIAVLGNVDS